MLLLIALNGAQAKRDACSQWLTKNSSTSSNPNYIARHCLRRQPTRWRIGRNRITLIKQPMIKKRSSSAGISLKMDAWKELNALRWNSWILLAKLFGTQKVITLQQWPTTFRLLVKCWYIVCQGAILQDPSPKPRVLYNPSVSIQPDLTSSLVHIFKCSNTIFRSKQSWPSTSQVLSGYHQYLCIQEVTISSSERMTKKSFGSTWTWAQNLIRT